MIDLLIEPELADLMLEKMADFFFRYTKMILDSANGCVDAIGIYNDLGTQNGMMISPETYRQFIKPRQKKFIEMVKSYGTKVFYHSCGAVEPILEDFISIGVDIVDPLQMVAMKVEPEYLKNKYGDRITFHGGLNTQSFVNIANCNEIANEVRHLVSVLARDGGYIMAGSHFYQVDIPPENIKALHQAILL